MIKVLAAEPRSKKRSGDEAFEVFLAASPLVAAPPPNLPRLVHNTASYAGYVVRGTDKPQKWRNSCLRLQPRSVLVSIGGVLMSCKVYFRVI